MKKILLSIAIVAALASCSKNESEVVSTSASQIQFTSLNDKVTRSANDALSDYKVYAKSTLAGETAWFMDETLTDANTFSSGLKYYYPASPATVSFYAYAPATIVPAISTYGNLSINYAVPSSGKEDFTVATPVTGKSSGQVALSFKHMLSKISVTATLHQDLLDAGYTIDLTSATATVVVAKNQDTVDATAANPALASIAGSSATYSGSNGYMVVPQTSTGTTIQLLNVTINKGGATIFTGNLKTYTIAAGNVAGDAFEAGSHYLLTLGITNLSKDGGDDPIFGDEITFDATPVDWNTVAGQTVTLVQP